MKIHIDIHFWPLLRRIFLHSGSLEEFPTDTFLYPSQASMMHNLNQTSQKGLFPVCSRQMKRGFTTQRGLNQDGGIGSKCFFSDCSQRRRALSLVYRKIVSIPKMIIEHVP